MTAHHHHPVVLGLAVIALIGFTAVQAQQDDEDPPIDIPDDGGSLIAQQFSATDPYENVDETQMIIDGALQLGAIILEPQSLVIDGDDYKVYADMCVYDPTTNKNDPGRYTTTSSIMAASQHCQEFSYTMDLSEVVQAARAAAAGVSALPVHGMIFTEPYSGAKIIAKSIAYAIPTAHVVSEHPALTKALAACDTLKNRYNQHDCSAEKQRKLVDDIIYLIGRTPSSAAVNRFYIKLSGESTAYMPIMTALYPNAPWLFVSREAEAALAKTTQNIRDRKCIKSAYNPSSAMNNRAQARNIDLTSLPKDELCANYLSSLVESAVDEYEKTAASTTAGTGMLVNYDTTLASPPLTEDDVVSNIVDVGGIFPHMDLQDEIDDITNELVKAKLSEVLLVHSDGSGGAWTGENVDVSAEVAAAAGQGLGEAMEAIGRL